MKVPTPRALHRMVFLTPKALHSKAQGRAAARPHSAPWVTGPTMRSYPEGVLQMPESTFDRPHNRETGHHRPRCATPSAYGAALGLVYPGCAANNGFAVSRRPWASEYNRFVVKNGSPYATGVTSRSPPYAEGVSHHSPGSRRGEAAKRTLGYGPHNTQIPRRGFTYDDAQSQT